MKIALLPLITSPDGTENAVVVAGDGDAKRVNLLAWATAQLASAKTAALAAITAAQTTATTAINALVTSAQGYATAAAASAAGASAIVAAGGVRQVSGLAQFSGSTKPIAYLQTYLNGEVAYLEFADGTVWHDPYDPTSPGYQQIAKAINDSAAIGGFVRVSGLAMISGSNGTGSTIPNEPLKELVVTPNADLVSATTHSGRSLEGRYDDRLLSVVQEVEGPALSRSGPTYREDNGQIVARYGRRAEKVLTTDGTNRNPRVIGDGVVFESDRNRGEFGPYVMDFDGSNQRAMLAADALYEIIVLMGQSNTPHYIAIPPRTTTPPYPGTVLMLTGLDGPIAEWPIKTVSPTATLTDCVEVTGESVGTSLGARLMDEIKAAYPNAKLVVLGSGWPGHGYVDICKGTGIYADILAQVQRVVDLGQAVIDAGKAPPGVTRPAIVRVCDVIHGEADYDNASYGTQIAQMQSDFEADVRAITGQPEEVPFIITQVAALRFLQEINGHQNLSVQEQVEMARANGSNIYLSGSTYQRYTIDYAHWTSQDRQYEGEFLALKNYRIVWRGEDWVPLSSKPVAAWTKGANYLDIPFNIPKPWVSGGSTPTLVFDTTTVSDPGNKGADFSDVHGVTLSGAPTIIGTNSDTLHNPLSGTMDQTTAVWSNGYTKGLPSAAGTAVMSGNTITFSSMSLGTPAVGHAVAGTQVTPCVLTAGSGLVWTFSGPAQNLSSRQINLYGTGPKGGARTCLRTSEYQVSRWDGTPLYDWAVIEHQPLI